MKILSKKILTLELWHDYYIGQPNPPELPSTDYDISSILKLVPTPDCLRVLKNLRWFFRSQPSGAELLAQVDETANGDFRTRIEIRRPYRLTFSLVVRDRYFSNFTNLSLTTARNQIYYFSNLTNNQGHELFLTQTLPTYAANTEYYLGQLVNHSGNTLEALRYQASAPVIPDNNDWETLPETQYVSELDQLPWQKLSRTETISSANPSDSFRFTLTDINQQETFAINFTVPDSHPPGKAITFSLNFSGQPPGRYQLSRDGTPIDEFVILDPITNRNTLALVEIALNPNLVPINFRLLEAGLGETLIRPKTYVIRLKNRSTRQRYNYEPEHPHGFCLEGQLPGTNGCVLIDPRFIVFDTETYGTRRPVGLRQRPEQLLNDGNTNLPVPSLTRIKPIVQPATNTLPEHISDIFSDIYL